ncbi:hypothetical protein ACRAWD_22425 [Caulobacter segnis]
MRPSSKLTFNLGAREVQGHPASAAQVCCSLPPGLAGGRADYDATA